MTFMQLEKWVLAAALLSTASQEPGKYGGRGRFGEKGEQSLQTSH